MQLPPDEPIEKVAAELPERPKLVTPGRVIMLVLALIGLYVVWPSLVATFGSVNELKHVAPGWFVVMAACEVAELRLHVAADRPVPRVEPVLR